MHSCFLVLFALSFESNKEQSPGKVSAVTHRPWKS